ncbi:putative transcription factor WRKY family [Medicago truncatula]|uniref:Putative transcription factor WRKY family n=1 Tax=Medicago truncatula TaxID=3880 RepID=A0A396J9F1_MEDTR|nr:putative transcription factor WRKY family [Medicago truncatula]
MIIIQCDSYYRSYYRCSYKSDEECEAMKHVQRIQEDPPLYRTIYYGHHSCKISLSNSEITLLEPNNTSSMFLSFNDNLQIKEQYPAFSSPLSVPTKQEPIDAINPYHNQLTSSDYPFSCDYKLEFDNFRHATMLSSTKSVPFHDGF